jgi:hypothetical protein
MHLHLLSEFGIEGNVSAEVVALPPGHPYLRHEGEAELKEPGRWGTTFTLPD